MVNRGPLWLAAIGLAGVQWLVSDAAADQIRYEELAESIRNVFWLDERLVYDGISSNVGWYGLLLATYSITGFSVDTAGTVRVVLHAVTLACAAALLGRSLRPGAAIVPLAVVGLSPAVLYFNTLQTSFGVDLTFAAVCLLLMVSIRIERPGIADLVRAGAAGVAAMLGATSYPSFLLYLPSLLLVWVWRIRRAGGPPSVRWHAALAGAAAAGALLPLALSWLWLKNPELLIHDPVTNAGLFRGGGGGLTLEWQPVAAALRTVAADLFVRGRSYYFELDRPDFSGALGFASAVVIVGLAAHAWAAGRADRTLIAAAGLLVAISLVVPSLSTAGPPGLRRATGLLAGVFALFAIVWHSWIARPRRSRARTAALALLLIVPLNAAVKVPDLVADLRASSTHRNLDWFATHRDPDTSLEALAANVLAGQPLSCPVDPRGRVLPCRYQEIYAALAGWFRWTEGSDREIRAVDWKTGRTIILSPSLWTTYYYPH